MRRALLIAPLLFAGCLESFDERPFLVTGQRVLSISAEPAESPPAQPVAFKALVVSPDGELAPADARWAFCRKNRSFADNNPVTVECLSDAPEVSTPMTQVASGLSVSGPVPSDACKIFGSETPPPQPNQPPARPVDPDPSGGYYQPLKVTMAGASLTAFGRLRIACALAQAPSDVVQAYRDRYRTNRNPVIAGFEAAGKTQLRPSEQVTLTLTVDGSSVEPYVSYDLAQRALIDRTEALSVAFFSTGGVVGTDTAAVEGTAAATTFTAPANAGTVHLWAVVRDDRGGEAFARLNLEVSP